VSGSPAQSPLESLLAQYDYDLPPDAIAQRPAQPRDAARLLVMDRGAGTRAHALFRDLPRLLRAGDLLVVNDTRVVPARLRGRKVPRGGAAELLVTGPLRGARTEALVRMAGRARAGQEIDLDGGRARLLRPLGDGRWEVAFEVEGGLEALVRRAGRVPLPPYIRREDRDEDREWYQTVYAVHPGAVAAPTAGLHFTAELLDRLQASGVALARVTLHVGEGTFRPLGPQELERGELHEERFELAPAAAAAVARARADNGRVVAVGTTSARVLEACAGPARTVAPARGATRLFIRPPFVPQVVDGLITNFHLPRTSLLMLVAAFVGREAMLAAYAEARERGYRFYSYGDAMLIT
jgi:S-adenosylmethionine:tRNA ribosyltransferase-isomerase